MPAVHLILYVADQAASIRFYTEALAREPAWTSRA
jgi:catechol 2,3-dioxygenase-like lactoylglutathione lyase family enzyme